MTTTLGSAFTLRLAGPGARHASERIARALLARGASSVVVQPGDAAGGDALTLHIGVHDASGHPRWLPDLRLGADAPEQDALAFLEAWGFVTRVEAATPPSGVA